MGLGDWIIATGQVRELHRTSGKKVVVVDQLGRPKWSEVFENNPRMSNVVGRHTISLLNCGGHRPYIKTKSAEKWVWKQWNKTVGELFISDTEFGFAKQYPGFIMVEPNTKVLDGNKAWIFDRWQELVNRIGREYFIQVGPENAKRLYGVKFVSTNVRQALAILSMSRAFVGTEGGLHHAAAALKIPAVVLWSHFISPEYTGYDSQTNIRHAGEPCGMRITCKFCKMSMEMITVDEVEAALKDKINVRS